MRFLRVPYALRSTSNYIPSNFGKFYLASSSSFINTTCYNNKHLFFRMNWSNFWTEFAENCPSLLSLPARSLSVFMVMPLLLFWHKRLIHRWWVAFHFYIDSFHLYIQFYLLKNLLRFAQWCTCARLKRCWKFWNPSHRRHCLKKTSKKSQAVHCVFLQSLSSTMSSKTTKLKYLTLFVIWQ